MPGRVRTKPAHNPSVASACWRSIPGVAGPITRSSTGTTTTRCCCWLIKTLLPCSPRSLTAGFGPLLPGYTLPRPRKEDQMSRTTGTSILVLGIVLGVVGAIMYWAVTAKADGFDINAAGLILFWVGVVTAVIGLVLTFMGNRSTTVRRADGLHGGRYEYDEEHRSL